MGTTDMRSRGRPTKAEAPARRAELIDVAARAFLANGYEGTSIEAIAAAARVSKATIYARFGNKENLFSEIGLHSVAGMRSDLHRIRTEGRLPEEVLSISPCVSRARSPTRNGWRRCGLPSRAGPASRRSRGSSMPISPTRSGR